MKFYSELSSDLRYIMRITLSQLVIAIIISGVSYAANSKAQGVLDNSVKIEQKSSSLSNVLKQLEKVADVKFVYSKNIIDVEQSASVSADNRTLASVLDELLVPKGIEYEVIDDKIVLNRSKEVQAADITITGTVTSSDGETLPGVSVKLKGASIGTSTNINGVFTLKVPEAQANGVLVFSYVGFAQQEISIAGKTTINVKLASDVRSINEVVVVGYGSQRKSDVTGSLTSVSAETLQERPVTNVLQALQGKAAGINVSSNLRPGEVPVIRVRGNRSINASNDPLYVIDGIPVINGLGVNSFTINDINPNDIASIEILKDASATAIYGSRGANGVVLISTKKGTKGKVTVNFNSNMSFDSYKSLTDWKNAGEYIDEWREALINGRQYASVANNGDLNKPAASWYPDPFLDNTKMQLGADINARNAVWGAYEWEEFGVKPRMRATTEAEKAMGWPAEVPIYNSANIPTYDWLGDATRGGVLQNHQLSLSTGSETAKLYVSFSTSDLKGIQRDQNFKRHNLNLSGEINANKWLNLGASIIGSLTDQNYGIFGPNTSNTGSKDLYSRAAEQYPYASPRDASGAWIRNAGGNLNLWNPLIDIDQAKNDRRSTSLMANSFAELKFAPWIKYRVNFGAQIRNYRSGTWTGPTATNHLTNRANTAGQSREENFGWVLENLIYLDKTIAKKHTFGVTLLQSVQKSQKEDLSASITGATKPLSLWNDLGSNSVGRPSGYGSGFTENALYSYMGRINYSFNNRYLLTASTRFDGASVLAPGHKWDSYASFALAWKMQEEAFIKNIPWIVELKPRVGYGATGNSAVDPYTSTGPLSTNPYIIGSTPEIGYLPQLVQNPGLAWEGTHQWNFGIDFSLFRSRISGSVEHYRSNTNELIFRKPVNPVSGYVFKYENIGETSNKGVEVTLSTKNIVKKDFSWSTDFNYTLNRERIEKLINGNIIASNLFIGSPASAFYYYKYDRLWQNTTEDLAEMAKFKTTSNLNFYPGTVKVVDQNNDYKIDGSDMVVLGSRVPKWSGGITNHFTYKNWDLSSFIYARIGQMYFGGYPNYGGAGRVENDVWSFDNPNGRWPVRMIGTNATSYAQAMQYNVGSFVSVRNISLTYNVPQKLAGKYAIKNLQLNAQIINPFIFGEIVKLGINPDDDTNWERISSNGAPLGGSNNNTVMPQSFVFGIRAGL